MALISPIPPLPVSHGQRRNRVFHRLTRRGKILKVVREHYLRDDISCGASTCPLCSQFEGAASEDATLLSDKPFRGQYVILDTNTVLHQMDVLEEDVDALRDVIVLQTVMEEVRGFLVCRFDYAPRLTPHSLCSGVLPI